MHVYIGPELTTATMTKVNSVIGWFVFCPNPKTIPVVVTARSPLKQRRFGIW